MENQNPPKGPAPKPKCDMGIFSWIITIILTCIPLVNIICMFVWAFSPSRKSRQNWAIAHIILFILLIAIAVGLCYAFGVNVNDVTTYYNELSTQML